MRRDMGLLVGGILALNQLSIAHAAWKEFEPGYIDEAFRKSAGLDRVSIDVLQDYQEITSAMMFGLSEKENVEFDCSKSRFKSNSDIWYEGRMGQGKITKKFGPDRKWSPIPPYYIKLFAKLCTP